MPPSNTLAAPGSPATATTGRSWWPSWLPNRRTSLRFSVFAASSVGSTLISQLVLTGVYWLGGSSAALASVLAFVAGAIPNFVINWKVTWRRNGRPAFVRELLPYLAIIIGGGLAATALTSLADHLLSPMLTGRGDRTIALDAVYLASYAVFFVVKFALLNRVLAARSAARSATPAVPAGPA
ncbi:MAG TPA: GtrA family protein [Pseudonocardiaceae bacterium]|nr:GtrA family protein [Pseudonocardiaceae bacterium]